MTQEENIIVPRWFLENVENTLRIQNNINLDKKTGETCQDRNVRESLNGLRKLLKGEELTGRERFEKLQPSLPSDLDEAAYNRVTENGRFKVTDFEKMRIDDIAFGAEWMTGQGDVIATRLIIDSEGRVNLNFAIGDITDENCKPKYYAGQDVIVQIRKK